MFGECCVGSGLWDGPITRPEESTGCVCVCVRERERERERDLRTSTMKRPRHDLGC